VKVIAEGQEKDIEKFIHDINIKNTIINVADINKEYSTPSGEYESFYKLVSEGETDERLDTAADLLKELINVTRNGFSGLEKKQDIMIGKQDIMIGKQQETMSKIDLNRLEIKSEIHALRDDFKSHFDNRLSKMEFELTDIKVKVAQIQQSLHNPKTKISQAD